jgi:hypothetical protein
MAFSVVYFMSMACTELQYFSALSRKGREAGHHGHHREEKTIMVWLRQKDARGENIKINYGMDTRRKRGRPRKTWMEGVHAAMTAKYLEQDQWRNR